MKSFIFLQFEGNLICNHFCYSLSLTNCVLYAKIQNYLTTPLNRCKISRLISRDGEDLTVQDLTEIYMA